MTDHKIPLRERKFARTKLTLVAELRKALEKESLEQLSVKSLCEAAEISEATFFNYFPKKSDLLEYLGRLWGLELQWHALRAAQEKPGLAAIHALFELAARHVQQSPGTYGEYIALLAHRRSKPQQPELTYAERMLAFQELDGIADLPEQGLDTIMANQVQRAIDRGELPANTHLQTVLLSLISIFYGVILALRASNPNAIGHAYKTQLALLWQGVKAAGV